MSDFFRPFRFPRSDGDVLAIEEIAPAPFLVDKDPGSVQSFEFPVKGEAGEVDNIPSTRESIPVAPARSPSSPPVSGDAGLDAGRESAATTEASVDGEGPEDAVESASEATAHASSEDLIEAIEAFRQAAVALSTARADAIAEVQEDLIELAVEMGQALVHDALERDPGVHVALARCALSQLESKSPPTLRASRTSYDVLHSRLDADGALDGVAVQLVLDESLDGSGYVAEAGGSSVDGRVNARLESVRRALREALVRGEARGEADDA